MKGTEELDALERVCRVILPFPGVPPRTPRLSPDYYRGQRQIRRRVRWWQCKRRLARHSELVAVLVTLVGYALFCWWRW